MRRVLVLVSWSILSSVLSTASSMGEEWDLSVDRISIEDGLSHSSVWAIHQDSRGFLWFGTQEGLNRYDGYDLKVYQHLPGDPESLSESEVLAIYEDRRGELWIGTRGGGLNRFLWAEERFEHFRHDAGDPRSLSHDVVECLVEDHTGTLWVGTQDGLNRYDRLHGTFTHYRNIPSDPSSLSGQRVWEIYEDQAGELWIGTDGGLNRLDRETESFERYRHDPSDVRSLSHDTVAAIHEDSEGHLWIGTAAGLDRLDRQSGSFVRYRHDPANPRGLSSGTILSLYRDSTGELWIGTHPGGLCRLGGSRSTELAPATGVAEPFVCHRHDPEDPRSLSSDSIYSVFEDRTGILWLATRDGVNRYDRARERFTTYRRQPRREPTLSSSSVRAVYEDSAGVLWLGTHDSGLNLVDRRRGTVAHYRAEDGGLRHDTVSAICEGRSGALWIGTWGGLSRLEPFPGRRLSERFSHYRHDPADLHSLSNDTVLSLHEDRQGRLWVGTFQGLNRLADLEGRFIRYPDPADRRSPDLEAIDAILEDRSGVLWFGSLTGGLYRLGRDGSERFERLRHDPDEANSLSSNKVASIYEDRSGTLWVGTHGAGLNRLDADGGFVHYRVRDGLPNDSVLGILEDDEGNLWLSTNYGLSRFDPRSETFQRFDVEDGLAGNVAFVGSSFRSTGGEMFFGGPRGLTAFFPDRITRDPHVPPIVITELRLFNEPVPVKRAAADSPLAQSILDTREIVLSHRDDVFSFGFAALDFSNPRKNRYAYRLEGFDRDWIPTDSAKRFAQYTNLDAGSYVFRVKGSNGDGVWNEAGATIRIRVRPPPWQSLWAYAGYVLALSAIILGFVSSQKRKVERERAINRDLRELTELKDALLAERAAKIAERGQLIAELEAKNAELERFTYTVSHDLKSPLVTIKGFLGYLRQDAARGDTERLDQDIERIDSAAGKMQRLLDELLELSRIGRTVNPFEEVPLADLAREAIDLVAGKLAERRVEVEIRPDLPTVAGDRVRLLEVLQNLIDNAASFMGDQPSPRIEVGARPASADQVCCYMRDNGVGIDPRYQEKVFGLFERLDAETEGTGIGLALAKRIVEFHGGRIWVESEGTGKGSTFCFTIQQSSDSDPVGDAGFSR